MDKNQILEQLRTVHEFSENTLKTLSEGNNEKAAENCEQATSLINKHDLPEEVETFLVALAINNKTVAENFASLSLSLKRAYETELKYTKRNFELEDIVRMQKQLLDMHGLGK